MDWDAWNAMIGGSPSPTPRRGKARKAEVEAIEPEVEAPARTRSARSPRPAPRPAPTATRGVIRLAYQEGASDKVYELEVRGSDLVVRWGRRGAKLQSKVTSYASASLAAGALVAMKHAKISKGYREVGGADDMEDELPAPPVEPSPSRHARASRSAGGPPTGVLLAKTWEGSNPTGWWMSEKLDGMRAYWTGSGMYTRNGNEVAIPTWYRDLLPNGVALDGELWLGRGKFQDTISVVRKLAPTDPRWRDIQYVVFDAPETPGGFEARIAAAQVAVQAACRSWRGPNCPIVALEQTRCTSAEHLKRVHAQISKLGGEGVMLRRPGSPYSRTRSPDLLKVKSFNDAEARITGYTEGTGKHAGRLGAYTAKLLDSGVEFKIGTGISDAERDRPLRVGTIVTVRFQELTRDGVPRFPSLVGARDYE